MLFRSDIFVENVIYDPAYGFIDGTPLYEILVVGGAVRDVKVVPARSVPFRIYSVQRKGNNSINIRGQGCFGPGGVDLAACHIFHVIWERYLYVCGR